MSRRLYLDNDHEPEYGITLKNTASGAEEAAAGLSSLTAWVSLTDGGDAVHVDLSVSATERTSTPGKYFCVFDGDKLRTHLLTHVGNQVYVVFGDGSNLLVSDVHTVFERRRSA